MLEQDTKSIQLLFCVLLRLNLHVEEAKPNNEFSLWDQQKFKTASPVYRDSFGMQNAIIILQQNVFP